MSAIILALVPFVRWSIERLFRRIFKESAAEAIKAAKNDSRQLVKDIADNPVLITSLSHYLKNWSAMEKFYQTCVFATLSIIVLMVTEDISQKPLLVVSVSLLVIIIVILLIAAIRGRKIDFATEGSTKRYTRSVYILDFAVLVFAAVVKLFFHKQT